MVLDVIVYKLDTHTFEDQKIGRIRLLESGKLTYWPRGSSLLRKMVSSDILGFRGRVIKPEQGEEFIRSLFVHFKSPYLRCTEAKEKD